MIPQSLEMQKEEKRLHVCEGCGTVQHANEKILG